MVQAFPTELLFQLASSLSRGNLSRLSRTCRFFLETLRPLVFRDVTLKYTEEMGQAGMESLLATLKLLRTNPNLSSCILSFDFFLSTQHFNAFYNLFRQMLESIRNAKKLRTLTLRFDGDHNTPHRALQSILEGLLNHHSTHIKDLQIMRTRMDQHRSFAIKGLHSLYWAGLCGGK